MPAPLRRALAASLLATALAAAPAAGDPVRPGCAVEEMRRAALREPPDQACRILRPGVIVSVVKEDREYACPTNFLFTGGNGARYLGLEGYCVVQDDDCVEIVILFVRLCLLGEEPETDGPVVYPKGKGWPVLFHGKRVGEVRYAIHQSAWSGEPTSFALLEVDPKVPVNPVPRGWDGPYGIDRRITTAPETLLVTTMYAEQEVIATEGMYDPVRFGGVHPHPPGLGAPVLTVAGDAVGLTVAAAPASGVERLDGLLARAGARLKTRLRLVTLRRP